MFFGRERLKYDRLYPTIGINAYKLEVFQMDNDRLLIEFKKSILPDHYKKIVKKEMTVRQLELYQEEVE